MLCKWEELPDNLRTESVRPYYDALDKRRTSLLCKWIFDRVMSFFMLLCLAPVFVLIAVAIKLDSPGPVFFRQVRVTQYGKTFKIFKFRSMVNGADKRGAAVTTKGDARVTKVGQVIRKYKLDELCQLIDIFRGTMSYVGTRPEVPKYVDRYTPEMMATLLLPAGVTSEASIAYKDEERILENAANIDDVYANKVLPEKMKYNLKAIKYFSFWSEIATMFRTVFAVAGERE